MRPIGDDEIERWVRDPAAHVRAALPRKMRSVLDRVEDELVGALRHRQVARGWVHGDFNAANVLVDGGRISGIVDWDTADPDSPVVIDAAMLLLWQNDARGPELGQQVLHGLAESGQYWPTSSPTCSAATAARKSTCGPRSCSSGSDTWEPTSPRTSDTPRTPSGCTATSARCCATPSSSRGTVPW